MTPKTCTRSPVEHGLVWGAGVLYGCGNILNIMTAVSMESRVARVAFIGTSSVCMVMGVLSGLWTHPSMPESLAKLFFIVLVALQGFPQLTSEEIIHSQDWWTAALSILALMPLPFAAGYALERPASRAHPFEVNRWAILVLATVLASVDFGIVCMRTGISVLLMATVPYLLVCAFACCFPLWHRRAPRQRMVAVSVAAGVIPVSVMLAGPQGAMFAPVWVCSTQLMLLPLGGYLGEALRHIELEAGARSGAAPLAAFSAPQYGAVSDKPVVAGL